MTQSILPFWLIAERHHVLNPPAQFPCGDPDAVYGFRSSEKLTAFLDARQGGRWDVNLVFDRESATLAVAELHLQSISKICLDPEPDGSGGESISLVQLLKSDFAA